MRRFAKDNGLTLVLMAMFLASVTAHLIAGWRFAIAEHLAHGLPPIGLFAYAAGAAFWSSIFENWESEFLQMSAYVALTAMLFQRGSAESRDPDAPPRDGDIARAAAKPGAPAMLRAGRMIGWVYAHSLGIVLFALFLASFVLHWRFSALAAAADARIHGQLPPSMLGYLGDPQLWFESFQNWQSEFLSTAVLVVLTIYLRQKDSPESKPLGAPHDYTGD